MIQPHGGKLVNKILPKEEAEKIIGEQENYKKVQLDKEQVKDVKNIARGVYSPLEGFLGKKDYLSVLADMRLASGVVWSIPIVLDIDDKEKELINGEKKIMLVDEDYKPVALLQKPEIYEYNKKEFAQNVYGTIDKKHPGVEATYKMNKYLVGGKIELLNNTKKTFPEHNFSPAETRAKFEELGWNKIVAFQTRNVPHRAHEFLQHEALSKVDGLFVQPVIGDKKIQDFKDEYILVSYEILIKQHFPEGKVVLGILPLKMRYAGPREAVFHALIRKNFGCTHFIVGRDHAGVGDYYEPFAAQSVFDKFKPEEIGIEIMKLAGVVYNKVKKELMFVNECPEDEAESISGTALREMIEKKEQPPEHVIRSEVFNFLVNSNNSLVDTMYKKTNGKQKGFVLWFTGLSQSGKTTTADAVYEVLKDRGIKIERLDGDIVRESLTKDLGFSKEDRDENIRRVGFVAQLLSRNGVGVISSFISPYKKQRDDLRAKTENFIEIFMNTPIEVCEKRDTRGLYAKARAGEIQNFTGVNDPFEEPQNPDIDLKTAELDTVACTEKVIKYLEDKEFIPSN
ncbi:MAG: sulfate adenylyltransferase [bacterium]